MHRARLLIAGLALVSCGGSPARAAPAHAALAHAAPAAAPASEDDWATLSWEERHDTMTWQLLPAMMPVFQKTFATQQAELNCRTCHGKNAEQVQYRMPNGLPALDPAHLPTGRIADAMRSEVTPLLSEILGKPSTCFSCHPSGAAK